jgi:hypothetical protein
MVREFISLNDDYTVKMGCDRSGGCEAAEAGADHDCLAPPRLLLTSVSSAHRVVL